MGSTAVEAHETFELNVDATPSDVTAGAQSTTAYTITNDDTASVTIDDVTELEGTGGTTNFAFTATLNVDVQGGFDVAYSTANGSTTAGDFDSGTTGTLNFPTGANGATAPLTVVVDADSILEANETFTVTLGAVTNTGATEAAAIDTTDTGAGQITNDDSAQISINANDDTASEPAGGNNGQFTVSVDNQSDIPTTISYTVTGDATSGSDYTALLGNVTIPASTSSATIDVTVLEDTLVENDETVSVTLNSVTAGYTGNISIDARISPILSLFPMMTPRLSQFPHPYRRPTRRPPMVHLPLC